MDYYQSKTNKTADVLSGYLQWNVKEITTFQAKITKILYYLQFSLAKVSGLSANNLSPFYQILIHNILIIPQVQLF